MPRFAVTDASSGRRLGTYDAESEVDAYRAAMRDAGRATQATIPANIEVRVEDVNPIQQRRRLVGLIEAGFAEKGSERP